MSTSDTIIDLQKRGVVSLNIGKTREGEPYVQAGQVVSTGPGQEDHIQVTHQIAGGLREALAQLGKQVDHMNALKGVVVSVKGGRG